MTVEMEVVSYQGWARGRERGKRVVIGHAVMPENFALDDGAAEVTFDNTEPLSKIFTIDPHAFWYGVCQPRRDAPLELVAWPQRAYPG